MNEVFAFEVSVTETDWKDIINTRNAGRAKSEYHQRVADVWPDIPYTAIRARKIGPPHTSAGFERNAKYRGMPDVRCGDRVKVGNSFGVIVGHNSSANFDILFDEDAPRYADLRLNVHPQEIEVLEVAA